MDACLETCSDESVFGCTLAELFKRVMNTRGGIFSLQLTPPRCIPYIKTSEGRASPKCGNIRCAGCLLTASVGGGWCSMVFKAASYGVKL